MISDPKRPVSLERSTPPAPPGLRSILADSLKDLAQMDGIEKIIRSHRFDGTEWDKILAVRWLGSRFGAEIDPDRVLLTNGAQNAMVMALGQLTRAGDTVLLETLSYHGFRKQAQLQNVRTQSIDMDDHGACPDAFEAACKMFRPKALFLMPTVHNPTSIVMPEERRLKLAEIARAHGVAIIEDDVYGLLPRNMPQPFGALAPDITWHINSFAKCLGPGGRLGYLVAPDTETAKATFKRFYGMSSWFPATISAEIIGRWLESGRMQSFVDEVRAEAVARQEIARDCLHGIKYANVPDGLFVWIKLNGVMDQDELVARAAQRNVIIRPGRLFATDPAKSPNAVRVVVGSPDTREDLRAALTVIGDLVRTAAAQGTLSEDA